MMNCNKAFWYNDSIICLKCALTREGMKYEGEDVALEYYVVDLGSAIVTKLESEDDVFVTAGLRFEWIPTKPAPEGCVYPE